MTDEKLIMLYESIVRVDWNIERLIAAICLTFLCRDCVKRAYTGVRKYGHLVTSAVYFLVYMGFYWLPGWGGYRVNMIALAAAFLVFFRIEPENFKTKLYFFSAFLVVDWMAASAANDIAFSLAKLIDGGIYRVAGPQHPAIQKYYLLSFCGYLVMIWILTGGLLFAVMHVIRKVYGDKTQEMERQEFLILMIPVINAIAARSVLRFYSDVYEEKTGLAVYENYPGVNYMWIIYYVVILASIVSTVYLYQRIRKKQEEEKAQFLLESQMKDIRAHIAEVEKLYTEIRGVKHDLRNHIEIINSLLASGKTEEAREYSNSLTQTVEMFDFSVKTGNPVTNVILHENRRTAEEKGIKFISNFYFPVGMGINAFDISVILSNALANAIEAASPGGTVQISSFRNKNAYLITVENSFEDRLEIDAGNCLPKTSKRDKKEHGLGLQNIQAVAAKYFGAAQIEQKDRRVVLTVMLIAETREENT